MAWATLYYRNVPRSLAEWKSDKLACLIYISTTRLLAKLTNIIFCQQYICGDKNHFIEWIDIVCLRSCFSFFWFLDGLEVCVFVTRAQQEGRHHICCDQCDRMSRKFFVNCEIFSANNANYEKNYTGSHKVLTQKMCNEWTTQSGPLRVVKFTHIAWVFLKLSPNVCEYWLNIHILRKHLCHFYAKWVNIGQIYTYCICLCAFKRIYPNVKSNKKITETTQTAKFTDFPLISCGNGP